VDKVLISVTDAARNFADCINRAHYQGVTFVLLKNGRPVAEIGPPKNESSTGAELAKRLARVRLSREESEAWRRDLRAARKGLKPPVDKWQ